MNDEQIRKDFEDWVSDGGLNQNVIDRSLLGGYSLIKVSCAWEAWKAAHTHYAKPDAPVALPQHPNTARLQQAVWRLEDLLKDDDPQAWKEARKFLERLKKEQVMEGQPQADAQGAAFEAVRKKLCKLQRYSFWRDEHGGVRRVDDRCGNWIEFDAAHELFDTVAIDAAIAAAKENK